MPGPLIMRPVFRPVARAAAFLLIAPFLTLASALAPQHVHEPGPGHDHDHPVAHSHFSPHDNVDTADSHDAGDTEIEHDIQHVVWLDSPILHECRYRTAAPAVALPVGYDAISVEPTWSVTPGDDAAPAHGPPKYTPRFRGPPTSSSDLI